MMRSALRLAASRTLSTPPSLIYGLRFASSQAAAESPSPEQPGDPGPSTLQNAKAQRRRLHAELTNFSENAKKSSVDLETFNDILAGTTAPPMRRRKVDVPTSTIQNDPLRAGRIKPTLADSPFALPKKGEEVILDESDEIAFEGKEFGRRERGGFGRRSNSSAPSRGRGMERERASRVDRKSPREAVEDPYKRIKDGPYALAARLKRWVEQHPPPLSSVQVEELITMVTESPKSDVNSAVWGQVLGVLGREKKLDRMWRAYNDMKKSGIKPTTRTYTTLLNAYASVAHSDDPALGEPLATPPEPRTLSRVAIIYRASQDHIANIRPAGDPSAESGLAYPSDEQAEDDGEVGVQATNAYLKFLSRYGMFAEAEAVFRSMLEQEGRMGPDIVSFSSMFTALLNAHTRQEQSVRALRQNLQKATGRLKGIPAIAPISKDRPAVQPAGANKSQARGDTVERPPRGHGQFHRPSSGVPQVRRHAGTRMGKFEHRPKVGFGLVRPSTGSSMEARTYTTDAPVENRPLSFDSIMEHVKAAGVTSSADAGPVTRDDRLFSEPKDNLDQRVGDGRRPRPGPRDRFTGRQISAQSQKEDRSSSRNFSRRDLPTDGRKPRHRTDHATTGLPRGAATAQPEPSSSEVGLLAPAVTPGAPKLQIGEKARWLLVEAVSRLSSASSRIPVQAYEEVHAFDQGLAILVIRTLLRGRPEDQRYAIALIPRFFDLPPPAPTSASSSEIEDLPEKLPSVGVSPSVATTLVSSLSRANRPTLATHYATIFLSPGRWKSKLDAPFFGTMIRALANTGDVHAILDVIEHRNGVLREGKCKWPMYAYCEALTGARWAEDWEAAKKAWGLMEKDYALRADTSASREGGGTRVDAKAMALLFKVALKRGKKDVAEALEIYERYGDDYHFGGKLGAGRKDALVTLGRKMRDKHDPTHQPAEMPETEEGAPDKKGGNAWIQELRVDIARARELLKPTPAPTSSQ